MKKLIAAGIIFFCSEAFSQTPDSGMARLPVRGFAIAAPDRLHVDSFVVFIRNELAPRGVNTLVLRVDNNYQYKSHPELSDANALTESDVKKILAICQSNDIRIVPQINLLGHQSWAGKVTKLLEVYPQFDETPWVKMPEHYSWPNADSLYCKSYCPLHPGVHKIVFDIVDELCAAFHAEDFHAGMDEVFYIGMDKCPRCRGKDKGVLFANEVTLIRDHLALAHRRLWIWGDRLIDGRTTGIGEWEASENGTWTAIDKIPKDIMICDWHYERPDKTAVLFASKGFHVITCPWNMPEVAKAQLQDLYQFRTGSTPEMSERFSGIMQTVWSDLTGFLREYYHSGKAQAKETKSQSETFRVLFTEPAMGVNSSGTITSHQ